VFGRLAARGHEVHLLCSGWKGALEYDLLDGIHVHRVARRYTFSLHARRYFRARLAPLDFDVLVEDLNKVPLFTPSWSRVPVVVLVHHLFGTTAFDGAPIPLAAATWLLERPIPLRYRGVPMVAVSESTRDDLVTRGIAADLIEVVPNGVDIAHFRPDPGLTRFSTPTVLFLGRLKRYKGVDLLLQAAARLREGGAPVRLLIGGRGDDLDRLRALSRELHLGEHVEFLGFVSEEKKLELFRRAWIHALPSAKEGWGIAVIEAGACGTPSVASDVPGLRESVRQGETGLLVPHGDIDALAGAIRRLCADATFRDGLGRAAVQYARRFTWEGAADRIEENLRRRVADAPERP
jgi:glycosyltransferase involved in cell wall biosynthesis